MADKELRESILRKILLLDDQLNSRQEASLSELPRYSRWIHRMLGIDEFAELQKTKSEILREYDRDKWGELLRRFHEKPWQSLRDFNLYYTSTQNGSSAPHVWRNKLLVMDQVEYLELREQLTAQVLSLYFPVETIVELGCGPGFVLLNLANRKEFRETNFVGGELSPNGVEVTNALAKAFNLNVKAALFDFLLQEELELEIPEDALIFTSFALVCIPRISPNLIHYLVAQKPKAVIHFEPTYSSKDSSDLMSLLQRRYIEINDYNTNLLDVLEELERQQVIQILFYETNLIGDNPFLPASLIVWTPCSNKS